MPTRQIISRLGAPTTTQTLRPRRVYGWRPDKPDARDVRKAARYGVMNLPPLVDLRATGKLPPVYDQEEEGSCTGNGIVGAFEYDLRKDGHTDYLPSRQFVYYNERVTEGTVKSDAGAEIRDGIKVAVSLGICHEALWPYLASNMYTKPSAAAYKDALLHRVSKYARVEVSPVAVQSELAQGFPVVAGFTVYESFESDAVAKSGLVPIPAAHERVLGGHCVLIVGYLTLKGVLHAVVRNSWGPGWGDQGYCYIPLAWLANSKNASDFWVIESDA